MVKKYSSGSMPNHKSRRFRTGSLAIILILAVMAPAAARDPFDAWVDFATSQKADILMRWMRCVLSGELSGRPCRCALKLKPPDFYGRLGVFITLVRGTKTVGCFGAFDHAFDDFERLAAEYLRGALRHDPRSEPPDTADEVAIIVTIADRPFPVTDINMLDISRHGVMITDSGSNSIVFVPAEIRSVEYLLRRIKKIRIAQLAGFRTITIRERKK